MNTNLEYKSLNCSYVYGNIHTCISWQRCSTIRLQTIVYVLQRTISGYKIFIWILVSLQDKILFNNRIQNNNASRMQESVPNSPKLEVQRPNTICIGNYKNRVAPQCVVHTGTTDVPTDLNVKTDWQFNDNVI